MNLYFLYCTIYLRLIQQKTKQMVECSMLFLVRGVLIFCFRIAAYMVYINEKSK